jgi:hypothetical protein
MCIPPKKGGKPCQGDSILVKSCNTHPCPKVFTSNEVNNNKNQVEIL